MIAAFTTLLLLAQAPAAADAAFKAKVDGDGFFRFLHEGRAVYLKEASFKVEKGRLCHVSGAPVIPTVAIFGAPEKFTVELDGTIRAHYGETEKKAGRFVLALFGPDIRPMESGEWLIAADKPSLGNPGDKENGVIRLVTEEDEAPAEKPPVKPETNSETKPLTGQIGEPEKTEKVEKPTTPDPNPLPAGVEIDRELLKAGGVQVILRASSEIEDDRILLGSIADIYAGADLAVRASEIDLGPAPIPGLDRKVNRTAILTRLRALGLKDEQIKIIGPSVADAIRKSQELTHEQFIEAAITGAKDQLGDAVEYKSTTPGTTMLAPSGDVQFVVERVTQGGAKVTAIIAVYVNGQRFNSRTVALEIDAPVVDLRIGQSVKVRVSSNGAIVETTGIVRSIRPELAQVTVETVTKATLTGTYKNGIVEVKA